jgi:caa(3)-type oxidase subunit IV
VGRYWAVWAILLIFTGLTVWTGRMDLGNINILLALTIASIKATLVVLFFMHMSEAAGANKIVFVVSLFFAVLMMIGVFGDLWTRNPVTLPSQSPFLNGENVPTVEPMFRFPRSAAEGQVEPPSAPSAP